MKCSRLSFFEIFLVPNEFTGCNLRVGIRRVHEEFALWKGRADSPPIFGPLAEIVLEHFTGLNEPEDTQHKHNKLHFSSKNQIE